MSEKRFIFYEYDDGTETIEDTEENEYYHFSNELVSVLNEQQDTIRKLQDLCGQSDSENARLRMENKILCDEIKLLKPTNIEQYEQIVQLQKENEELRFALRAEQALAKIQSIK